MSYDAVYILIRNSYNQILTKYSNKINMITFERNAMLT